MDFKIAIVSPSCPMGMGPEDGELEDAAVRRLSELGVECSFRGNAVHGTRKISSTTFLKERLDDFYAAFEDDVDCVVCSQGGDNCIELLLNLDFGKIKNIRRPFFGQSDITVLLNAIHVMTGEITYHGLDLLWGLGKNRGDYTEVQFLSFLKNGCKLPQLVSKERKGWKSLKHGVGQGKLLGGCMSSFSLLLGTRFDPLACTSNPYVLFLEDIGESFERLSALMTQLRLHDRINDCKGVVYGNFFLCSGFDSNETIESLILGVFGDLDIPLLFVPELGHAVENMIMPIGAQVLIESGPENNNLTII